MGKSVIGGLVLSLVVGGCVIEGPQGPAGAAGEAGPQGDAGATGEIGPVGEAGPAD